MTVDTRIDPRAYSLSAIGLVTLAALFGTSVPVVREAETVIVRPFYASSSSATGAQSTETKTVSTAEADASSTGGLIAELRAATSFTWDQTSKLLGVSRRTVHLWAAGGNISAHNEERLASLVREVRSIQAADAGEARMRILALLDRKRAGFASANNDINRAAPVYAADA
ncbi:hypothetical protein [Naumannella halotolerans]|nr:hypothetical protein [Naumannella halotolerans]